MRIVFHYNSLAQYGGVERVISDKMNYMVNMGYDIYMITTDQGTHLPPYKLDSRIHFIDLGIRFHTQYNYSGLKRLWIAIQLERKYRKKLRTTINNIKPDIIVGIAPMDLHAVIKYKGDIPLIVESHLMCDYTKFNEKTSLPILLHRIHLKKAYCRADIIVALTEGDANDWRKSCNKVKVIPNIVHINNTDSYCKITNKSVIFVGRLTTSKGIPYLLSIWNLVQQKHPDWTLNIYGEGPEKELITNFNKSHHANIFIHEPSSDIMSCYKNSSILVMTSYFESFGLVLPEAMSCGLPTIAFDCPYGPHDIIEDGLNGFLIECYNIEKFANSLCLLMDNSHLRKHMSIKAIQSAQRYKAERIMPQWIDLYESTRQERLSKKSKTI